MAVAAYAITIFASAFLLFQVQPLISKFILPWFGGSPGVWTTCVLFFQIVLFLGYTYAHLLTKLPRRWQLIVHGVFLLAAAMTLLMAIVLLRMMPDLGPRALGWTRLRPGTTL